MFELWDDQYIGCSECHCVKSAQIRRFLRIQPEYRKIRTRKNSVFGHFSRSVWDVGCLGCGLFAMWDFWNVICLGCGLSGCGMFEMYDEPDMGQWECGMWDTGCLPGCRMLIYKMPFSQLCNYFFFKLNAEICNWWF